MKKIIFILVFLMFSACSVEQHDPKTCAFCGGYIYYHKIYEDFFGSKWVLQKEHHNDKYYHPWCWKIIEKDKNSDIVLNPSDKKLIEKFMRKQIEQIKNNKE